MHTEGDPDVDDTLWKPVPVCKIAREQGCDVPLDCLFGCPHNCLEEHRKANPPKPRPTPDVSGEFEVLS